MPVNPRTEEQNAQPLAEGRNSRLTRAQQALARRQPRSLYEQRLSEAAGETFFEHLVQCSLLFARMSMIMTQLDMVEAADSAAHYAKLFMLPAAEFRGDEWARKTVIKWTEDAEFTDHFEILDNLIEGTEFCLDMADDPEGYLDTLYFHLSTEQ